MQIYYNNIYYYVLMEILRTFIIKKVLITDLLKIDTAYEYLQSK